MMISKSRCRIALILAFVMVFVQTFTYISFADEPAVNDNAAVEESNEGSETELLYESDVDIEPNQEQAPDPESQDDEVVPEDPETNDSDPEETIEDIDEEGLNDIPEEISEPKEPIIEEPVPEETEIIDEKSDDDYVPEESAGAAEAAEADNAEPEVAETRSVEPLRSGSISESLVDGVLTLSGSGEIPDEAYRERDDFNKLVISEGITGIGNDAFSDCANLSEVSLPKSLRRIGWNAFWGDSEITEFVLPDSELYMEEDALAGTSITEIVIPVKFSCDSSLFDQIDTLEKIVFSDGRKEIPDNICDGSTVKEIVFPKGVEKIGNSSFAYCTELESITIPSTVKYIGWQAFYGDSQITEFVIPEGNVYMDDDALGGTSIREITIPAGFTCEGSLFDQIDTFEKIVFSDGRKEIPDNICEDSTVKEVVLPNGVEKIGNNSFAGCTEMIPFTLPSTINYIGWQAFKGDSQITEFVIPEGAFMDDDALAETSIREITIPVGFTCSGSLFDQVDTLERIVFSNGIKEIPDNICEDSTVKNVVLPSGIEKIGSNSFAGCKGLIPFALPKTVNYIGWQAFRGDTQITEFVIPEGAFMDDDALAETSIREITIPVGFTSSGSLFDQVDTLEKIVFSEGISEIPWDICEGSTVKDVVLPDGLLTIDGYAFSDCPNLKTIDIPQSVEYIDGAAFNNKNLKFFCSYKALAVVDIIQNGWQLCDSGEVFKTTSEHLLLPSSNTYSLDSSSASVNGCIPFGIRYKLKDKWFYNVENKRIRIYIPKSTELNENTILLDGELCQDYEYYDYDRILEIPVENQSGTITFGASVRYKDTITSYALMMAEEESNWETRSEIIGVINEEYAGISFSCDSQTSQDTIKLTGVAPSNAQVLVFVNDEQVKTITAKKTGTWSTDIGLPVDATDTFRIFDIKAMTYVDEEEVYAVQKVSYRKDAPEVISLVMEYTEHGETKTVDLMDPVSLKQVVYFEPGTEFIFKVGIKNSETVDAVYVTSTRNNVTRELKAEYDAASGLYITSGFFDPEDTAYVPGRIAVTIDKKSPGIAEQEMNTIIDNLADDATANGAKVTNKTVTEEADGIKVVEANVDLSELFKDEALDDMKMTYKEYDKDSGLKISDVFEDYGFDAGKLTVITTDDGEKYTIGYDFSNYKKITMVVSKGADIAGFISEKLYAITLADMGYKSFDEFRTAFDHAQNWSYGTQAVSYVMDCANIYFDHQDLVKKINQSSTITDKSRALREADELAHDQFMFLTLTTVMGIAFAATGFTAAIPALALLAGIKLLSDVFWQGRTNHALTGEYGMHMIVDPSGYIYDMDTLERVPDATVSAYWIPYDETSEFWDNKPSDEEYGVLWDAEEYDQENPLITNSDGKYSWVVPQGWWRVKTEKEGYDTKWSAWLPVPPVQTEVNIGLLSNAPVDPETCRHPVTDNVNAKDASCTENGYTGDTVCTRCGKVLEEGSEIPAFGHDWSAWGVEKAATYTAEGINARTCFTCGEKEQEAIPKLQPIKITPTVTLSKSTFVYNGKVQKPTVTVKNGTTKLTTAQYTLKWQTGCKVVGTHKVTVTLKGKYSGTKTVSFKINPKPTTISSVTAASKALTVKWKKQATQTTGYQIQVATNSGFTSNKKTVKITSNKTVSKKITGLKGGKKYYIRIRTYKKKTVNGKDTYYYSAWKKYSKTVTTKK